MKFISAITAFGLIAMAAAATQAEAQCGDLEVLNIAEADIPAGVDPTAIRTCKNHPEGSAKESLSKRKCWTGAPVGCSKNGYCYKSCGASGSGEWCWTALNGGLGDWKVCNSDEDCSSNDDCGAGNCKECGCSC
ncbi:hypothetical protein PISL3812_00548 [Talaromyces islandicus]|uniref:IDI-2 n=1 Tax=Talaromyces islandicus TaxID=28573 RepID=A0A0U1LJM6_TALIS|nr:hypothetical protein PISL3812_00548 [Talaromyces islandicus]